MKAKKVLGLLLTVAMAVGTLAGCGDNAGTPSSTGGGTEQQSSEQSSGGTGSTDSDAANAGEEVNTTPFYMTLDPNVSGEIDIMTWSGDSTYHADLGHWDADVQTDLTSGNVAMVYAMAKKFNEMYPNVKINLYAKADDGNSNDTLWSQELENFKAEHGKYPDIYCSMMLPQDVADGMVADLSVYADDPMYQSFNSSIMDMMNYYGVQAGLPQYMIPWGVYVNRELAELNNIDTPDPDWTIDEYTDFVTSADNTTFWGLVYGAAATQFIGTGTTTVNQALRNGEEVNIASDEVMSLLDYIPKWSSSEIWAKNNEGAIDSAIMDDGWWWSYRFFCRNYCLTNAGDPWFFNSAALGQNEDGTWPNNAIESGDWDIYPRPSTDYQGCNVGIVIDPMALHNFAMDDGDPALSDAEKANMDLAYAFGSYWCGSTEAMQARADQMYNDNGTLKTSLNDSFPLVTGEEFDKQMDIWYNGGGHERFGDEDLMPGFQYVLQLWQEGAIYDYSDKCAPCKVMIDGSETSCLYEWENLTNSSVSGVGENDPSWLDTIKANLPDWNTKTQERLAQAAENLKTGLKNYYGLTDADF
ncbi:MAG: hypothetical protein NC432_11460 [Roseburia sp.]|nr:hypothetical protein [Roseburia sp.]MCM1099460.1 hypothetical protein [Ruminococcus flavefaciens]